MGYSALWVPAFRSPLPLHAPPMTRNNCTAWKGDLSFQDAHLLVPWIALGEPGQPFPVLSLLPPSLVIFLMSICEVPKFQS